MTMYDKLGDLLSEVLDSGNVPQDEKQNLHSEEHSLVEHIPVPPEEVKNALKTLGLSSDFTYEEARQKYREKLKTFHPDKNKSNKLIQKIAREKTTLFISAWKIADKWMKENR